MDLINWILDSYNGYITDDEYFIQKPDIVVSTSPLLYIVVVTHAVNFIVIVFVNIVAIVDFVAANTVTSFFSF